VGVQGLRIPISRNENAAGALLLRPPPLATTVFPPRLPGMRKVAMMLFLHENWRAPTNGLGEI